MDQQSDQELSPQYPASSLEMYGLGIRGRPSSTPSFHRGNYVHRNQQPHWLVSHPIQQSPMPISPVEAFDAQLRLRRQRLETIREGFLNAHRSYGVTPSPSSQQRLRPTFLRSIPPPPVFANTHREGPIPSTPSLLSAASLRSHRGRPTLPMPMQAQGGTMSMPVSGYETFRESMEVRRHSMPPAFSATDFFHQPFSNSLNHPAWMHQTHIPTQLSSLQPSDGATCRSTKQHTKPSLHLSSHILPPSFYPSSEDVVIEWGYDDQSEICFPGKNQQFEAILSASLPKFLSLRTKGQVSTLIETIVNSIQEHGHFVVPQRFQDNRVLWRCVDVDMARAYCMHQLQLMALAADGNRGSSRSIGDSKRSTSDLVLSQSDTLTWNSSASGQRQGHRVSFAAMEDDSETTTCTADDSCRDADLINVKFKRPRKRARYS